MKYVYPAVLHPEEDGGYSVFFADFKGCITQGDDLYDALFEAQDALNFWLDYLEETGKEIPQPSAPSDIELESGAFINLIWADTDAWRKLNAKRSAS